VGVALIEGVLLKKELLFLLLKKICLQQKAGGIFPF
jgi:hypothetical protein